MQILGIIGHISLIKLSGLFRIVEAYEYDNAGRSLSVGPILVPTTGLENHLIHVMPAYLTATLRKLT